MEQPLAQLIATQADRLGKVGIDSATAEIELMLCHILKTDRLHLYLNGAEQLNENSRAELERIMTRRLTREPLQFILGEAWFFGRTFTVSPSVMAPTPETELLCESAIGYVQDTGRTGARILDIGVGSGVISVTLALELSEVKVVAVDLSDDALAVARTNVETLGAADRVELRHSDLFSAVKPDERFDLIVSNPPYIREDAYAGLPPEVLADPKLALVSGEDGLDAIREIVRVAPDYLAEGGRILFEIGYDQSALIAELTGSDDRYTSLIILKDLNDIDRIVILGCD